VAHTRCRKNDYPNHSYRDRLRFLVFTSWWTVVFTALFLVFFLINKLSFIVSIASHGIWFALTYVLLTFLCIPSTDRVTVGSSGSRALRHTPRHLAVASAVTRTRSPIAASWSRPRLSLGSSGSSSRPFSSLSSSSVGWRREGETVWPVPWCRPRGEKKVFIAIGQRTGGGRMPDGVMVCEGRPVKGGGRMRIGFPYNTSQYCARRRHAGNFHDLSSVLRI